MADEGKIVNVHGEEVDKKTHEQIIHERVEEGGFPDDMAESLGNVVDLGNGTIMRTDLKTWKPIDVESNEDYLKNGDITKDGYDSLDRTWYSIENNDENRETIENYKRTIKRSEKALVLYERKVYLGGILPEINQDGDGVCDVVFQKKKGDMIVGYFPEKAVKHDEIFENIKNREGNFKKGDYLFLEDGEATILGRVIDVSGNKYKIEIGIERIGEEELEEKGMKDAISKHKEEIENTGMLRGMGIVNRNIEEINEFNDAIVSGQ